MPTATETPDLDNLRELALFFAHGDEAAQIRIRDMDESELEKLVGGSQFADEPGTHPPHPGLVYNKDTHRYEKPAGDSAASDGEDADLAKDFPAESKDAGIWGKVKSVAKSVSDRVNTFLVAHADKIHAVATLLDAALVTPDDMKKFGVNPDGSAAISDAFKDATGIGGHVGAKLIGLAVVKGWQAAKRLAGLKAADSGTLGMAADFLTGLLNAACEGLGLPPVDRAKVWAALDATSAPAG